MSVEQNTALALRYYAECPPDDGDPEKKRAMRVVEEILTPDFTMYFNGDSDDEAYHGLDEHKQFLIGHTSTFPGERWTVEAIVADEQTVAARWHCQARHAETGKAVDAHAADFFTVRDGRLAVLHRFLDFEDLHEQTSPEPAGQVADM